MEYIGNPPFKMYVHSINHNTQMHLILVFWLYTYMQIASRSDNSISLPSSQYFIIKLELMCCPLADIPPTADLMHNLEEYLPANPVYNSIATQDLHIQEISSGFHHFFPVYTKFNQ
jgi:hypothetical protein